jgi:hypothetical protein
MFELCCVNNFGATLNNAMSRFDVHRLYSVPFVLKELLYSFGFVPSAWFLYCASLSE